MTLTERAKHIRQEGERIKSLSLMQKPKAIESAIDDVMSFIVDMAVELEALKNGKDG